MVVKNLVTAHHNSGLKITLVPSRPWQLFWKIQIAIL
jgi:hypothetical protein